MQRILLSASCFLVFLSLEMFSQRILVAYYSQSGRTKAMAEAVTAGARSVEYATVRLLSVDSATTADLLWADAIIIGSPVHGANVAAPVIMFMNAWPWPSKFENKIGAAFVTGGGISAGEELTQTAILHTMLIYGMIIVGGPTWEQAFGASAITDEAPFVDPTRKEPVDPRFIERAFGLGKRVAEVAKRMRAGE
jgi:NAD(P)H dehydrogenase (quinone)